MGLNPPKINLALNDKYDENGWIYTVNHLYFCFVRTDVEEGELRLHGPPDD